MKKIARTRLIEERKQRNWSQQTVADLIGTTRHNVSRWEAGLTTPGPYFRVKLCELYGKSAQELGFLPDTLSQPANVREEEGASVGGFPHLASLQPSGFWGIPYPRNPFFTGREEVLRTLHERLTMKYSMALTQSWAMSGLGGIGKTQIALEYAYRYAQDYTALFWVHAATREAFQAGLVSIAEILHLPEKDEHDYNQVLLAVKKWLATHQKWLLILDNVEDATLVRDMVPTKRSGYLLLTTRAQALGPLAQQIEIETMGLTEGTLFLLRRAKLLEPSAFLDGVSPEQLATAETIVIEMDFLPLALDQAGAYIDEVGCSLQAYLERYRTHRAKLLQRRGHVPGDHPESVVTTWSLNFHQVEQANPAAAELLRLCAYLSPDAIPEELISEGETALGPVLQPIARDAFVLDAAIEELRRFSLVQRDPEGHLLRLHRLVQAVLKDAMGMEEQRQWAERVVRATGMAFPETVEFSTWSRCQRFLSQVQVCSILIREYDFVFAEAATLLCRTASYLYDVSLYEQAEALFQQSLGIWERAFGPNHIGAATVLAGLARVYDQQGKYAQAEPLFRRALAIRERSLGPEHPDVASVLYCLAMLYAHQKKYEQAESLFRQVLSIRERSLGPEHRDVAITLGELGNMLVLQGKYKEAEALGQQAVHIWKQVLKPAHPWIVHILNGLAVLFAQQGKYEQAEMFFQQALHICEQALGPQHADVAETLNNLGTLYEDLQRFAEAEGMYQRALAIWEQAFGPEHPYVAYPLKGLADLCQKREQDAQAEVLYRRTLHIWEQAFGPEHCNIAEPLHGLANLYRKRGMRQQAEPLYQRALSIREQTLGEHHPETATILYDFAAFLEAQSRHQEAAALYQRTLAIQEQVYGRQHPKTTETRERLGTVAALEKSKGSDISQGEQTVLDERTEMGKSEEVSGKQRSVSPPVHSASATPQS